MSNMATTLFPISATITPKELANLLDLVAKVNAPIGLTITTIAPVIQRAAMLASLPEGARIGEVRDPTPSDVPPGTPGTPVQLELPLEVVDRADYAVH